MPKSEQSDSKSNSLSWKESPFLFLKGFLMGSADIVPGVSGGTMALIVGIYTRLIDAIKSFDAIFFKRLLTFRFKSALREVDWPFLLVLFCGMMGAILFFTKVVPLQVYMFTDPELIYGLFFGLIVGSIVILVKAIDGFSWIHGLMVMLGAIIGFWVVTLVPTSTPESPLFVFLSGSIAICAMVLPGISGSYILLILRKYDYILSEVGKIGTPEMGTGLWALLPFVLGAICGLAIFSRILSWLLNRYEAKTLAVLIGFLIGSLYVIWPYQDRSYKEIVTERNVVEYHSRQAQDLRNNPINKEQPEFTKLGEIISADSSSMSSKRVEVLTIKQKLIASSPFVPYITRQDAGTSHFWSGIGGMLIGLLMVLGLDKIRGTSP